MKWRRKTARVISEIYALLRCYSQYRPGFRILMYHSIGTHMKNNNWKIFCVSPKLFESHIAELAVQKSIRMTDFNYPVFSKDKLNIAITFDDGYRDNLSVAAPILLKYKMPFSVFITVANIKKGPPQYLSVKELQELAMLPFVTIGSHGVTHKPLTLCRDHELLDELQSSKYYLEDITGKEITSITYPHGAVDLRVRSAVQKAGYKQGATSIFNINTPSTDLFLLCRTPILDNDSLRVFNQKLNGDWDWNEWQYRIPFKKNLSCKIQEYDS